jgi:hypothetical protein
MGWTVRRGAGVPMAGAVAGLLMLSGCGDAPPPLPPPAAATADTAGHGEGSDGAGSDARCAAAEVVDQAHAQLWELEDRDGRTDVGGRDPADLRDTADSLEAFADATDRLGELVAGEQQVALAAWASPYRQLAVLYRELDGDLDRLDPDDADQMDRLADASGGVLGGPRWTDQQRDAFDQLLDELSTACPELDLGLEPDDPAPDDPSAVVGRHTVTLSDAAIDAIETEAAITREALGGALEGDPPASPCPLWDPEAVASAVGDLLDDRIALSDTVDERQVAEQWWSYGCGSVDGRPDPTTSSRGPLSIAARSLDGPRSIYEGATPQQAGVHAVFLAAPTEEAERVFAVDLEHGLLLLVHAGSVPLAEAVMAAVLDVLTERS